MKKPFDTHEGQKLEWFWLAWWAYLSAKID